MLWENERMDGAEGGKDMGERRRQACVTCLEQCVAACLKFGSSYTLPLLLLSLLLFHLHRNVQLDLIREAEGKSNRAWDQKPIWGQAWSCDLINLGGRQQRQSVSLWKKVCLYLCNRVSVSVLYECDSKRGMRLVGSMEDVNVSLRWQQQHSRTQTCVWHEEGGESISYPTIPSSSFSCCAVQTLEAALNSCRQAPGGKWATFAVAVPSGLAGESLSFSNILHLCLPFVLPVFFSSYPPSVFSFLPSLVFDDCLRKMTVPPQLAGLRFTETNK